LKRSFQIDENESQGRLMSRGPLTFRKRDLQRALTTVTQAGHDVARVEIDKAGKIVLILNEDPIPTPSARDWDKALSNDR
jgi:hypothetical protein